MTNIQVENLSEVRKKLTFEIPNEKVTGLIDSQYRDLKKNVQIRGFRKGKVPLDLVRAYFKKQVEEETKRKLIEETFQPGLDEKKIILVSVIKIEPEELAPNSPFKYTAEVEVPPPITVKDYRGMKLTKFRREVDDAAIEDRLQRMREQHARLVPIDAARGVKEGDHLVVDIVAKVDDEEIPSLTVTDYHLELGRDFYLPEFDSKLEGLVPERTTVVKIDLPADFPGKELAGKAAEFQVTINEAKERVLPPLDDDFAGDVGDYASLDDLKEKLRKDLTELFQDQTRHELESRIIDALIEKHGFAVPEAMVEHQIDVILSDTMQHMMALGLDPKRLPAPTIQDRDRVRPRAERTVRAGLILKAISDQEGLEISDEELKDGIRKRAEQIDQSADYFTERLEQDDLVQDFRARLLQEKAFALIQDHAEITEADAPPNATLDVE